MGTLTAAFSGLSHIAPGLHVLRSAAQKAMPPFRFLRMRLPVHEQDIQLSQTAFQSSAISINGQRGTLATSSRAAQPVLLDHQSAGSTFNGSLPLPALPPGDHHILIGRPGDLSSFDLTVHSRPSILYYRRKQAHWKLLR